MSRRPAIYIDGQEGTTGLRIRDLLAGRGDLDLRLIPDDDRKDPEARRHLLNEADLAILCLPDDAAAEALGTAGSRRRDPRHRHQHRPPGRPGLGLRPAGAVSGAARGDRRRAPGGQLRMLPRGVHPRGAAPHRGRPPRRRRAPDRQRRLRLLRGRPQHDRGVPGPPRRRRRRRPSPRSLRARRRSQAPGRDAPLQPEPAAPPVRALRGPRLLRHAHQHARPRRGLAPGDDAAAGIRPVVGALRRRTLRAARRSRGRAGPSERRPLPRSRRRQPHEPAGPFRLRPAGGRSGAGGPGGQPRQGGFRQRRAVPEPDAGRGRDHGA